MTEDDYLFNDIDYTEFIESDFFKSLKNTSLLPFIIIVLFFIVIRTLYYT